MTYEARSAYSEVSIEGIALSEPLKASVSPRDLISPFKAIFPPSSFTESATVPSSKPSIFIFRSFKISSALIARLMPVLSAVRFSISALKSIVTTEPIIPETLSPSAYAAAGVSNIAIIFLTASTVSLMSQ